MGGPPNVIKLDRVECISLLMQARIGRIVLSIDALPAARTVRFALSDDHIVFRVSPASRLRKAAKAAVVGFHADHYDEVKKLGWAVMVLGVGQEVSDTEVLAALRSLPLDPWAEENTGDHFMRIPITSISGERVVW